VNLDIAVTKQAAGTTFNVEERSDRPVILYQRGHQSRRIEFRAVELATNQSYLLGFADFVNRNAVNTPSFVNGGFSAFTWDGKALITKGGKTNRREVPTGQYQLQIVVTKALAEEGNAAHIETWTSPTINIVR
jgi:hypothetical protein